jgi:hypothetical protein
LNVLKSVVDVSICAFKNDSNEIKLETTHAHIIPNVFPPHDVDIIGEYDGNMNNFIDNLETNASFYPSMRQKTPLIIPALEMFGYLHPKTDIQDEPSSSKLENIQKFYVNKVTNIPINIEETYGK